MQKMTRVLKSVRAALVTGSLLAALALGGVAADSNEVGLTECDHGCIVEQPRGGNAGFSLVNAAPIDVSGYESAGPGEPGYTR